MILPILRNKKAFSVMELLGVLAILAILMAVLVPAISGARHHFNVLKTKAQFQRYSLALENYKAEYGNYPNLGESPIAINQNPGLFVEFLSAHGVSGSAMSNTTATALNPDGIMFCQFASDEVTEDGSIIDGLGNTNIELFFDEDGDGFLEGVNSVRARIGWRSGNITSW